MFRFPPEAAFTGDVLPWEMTWDTDRNQAVLDTWNRDRPCERYVDINEATLPWLAAGHDRICSRLGPDIQYPEDMRKG